MTKTHWIVLLMHNALYNICIGVSYRCRLVLFACDFIYSSLITKMVDTDTT